MAPPLYDRFLASTIEIVLHMQQEGSQRANVFHYQYTGIAVPSLAQLNELAQNFWGVVNGPYTAMANANLNFNFVTARDIAAAGRLEGVYNIPQPHAGSTAGVASPANATAAISWRTGIAGRFGRGRNYICGLSDGSASGSAIVSGYQAQMLVLATAIKTFNNSTGTLPVIFGIASFKHEVFIAVIEALVDVLIDSQRRRLFNRGS